MRLAFSAASLRSGSRELGAVVLPKPRKILVYQLGTGLVVASGA